MWIKLTSYDGSPVRINMDNCSIYYPHVDDDANTFVEYKDNDEEGKVQGVHVKETIKQIDAVVMPCSCAIVNKSGW